MVYRLFFEKMPDMHLIGHLDLMRVFQRAVNRAGLPIAYSQGFNPHQIMSFAMPLSLGYRGLREIIEIELSEELELEEVIEKLDDELPLGLRIVDGEVLEDGEKNAASRVIKAAYKVKLPEKLKGLTKHVEEFMEKDEVLYERKARRGIVVENARDKVDFLETEGDDTIHMVIAAGSIVNLRPDVVITLLGEMSGLIEAKLEEELGFVHCTFTRKEFILE